MAGPGRIPTRYDQDRQRLVLWRGPWLVRCPRCDGCARVEPERGRLVCGHCSLVRAGRCALDDDGRVGQTTSGEGVRWQRGTGPRRWPASDTPSYELWLREPCGADTVWATNPAHLREIERALAGGELSERAKRLPAWMRDRARRGDVLLALARLHDRVDTVAV